MTAAARKPRPAPHGLTTAVLAFGLWASAFVALYAMQALGCRFGWDRLSLIGLPLHYTLMAGAWMVHLGALAFLVVRASAGDPGRARMGPAGVAAALAALLSTVWSGLPLFVASACL